MTGSEGRGYTGPPVPPEQPSSGWKGADTGWAVTSTMLSALLVCGGLGWLVDRLTGLEGVFLPVGLLGGAAAGVYLVYVKYGKGKSA